MVIGLGIELMPLYPLKPELKQGPALSSAEARHFGPSIRAASMARSPSETERVARASAYNISWFLLLNVNPVISNKAITLTFIQEV